MLPYYSNNRQVYSHSSYQNIHSSPKFPFLHENHSDDDPSVTDDSWNNDNISRNYNGNVRVSEIRMLYPSISRLIELSRFLTHNLPDPVMILVFLVLLFDSHSEHFDVWLVIDSTMLMNVLCCSDRYARV